ncbi:MAG: Ig-like domain-containing protein [Algicola sp.]|nr:Ig-like domain-containing protein [Algicola sp.]
MIDPISFNTNAVQQSFDVSLAGVQTAYFTQGAVLFDQTGARLFTFNGKVTAMAYIHDRLLVAIDGDGIFFVDPAENFALLGNYPLADTVNKLVVDNDRLLVLTTDSAGTSRQLGMAIAGNSLREMINLNKAGVVDAVLNRHKFYLVQDSVIETYDRDFVLQGTLSRHNGIQSLRFVDETAYIATLAGDLYVINTSGERKFALNIAADKLLSLPGQLLAISTTEQQLQIVDIRDPQQPDMVGRLAHDIGSNVASTTISHGVLWLPSGAEVQLVANTAEAYTRYQPQRSRGKVSQVSIDNGMAISAAEHYGSIFHQAFTSNEQNDQVYPSPAYSAFVSKVAIKGEDYYLLKNQFKQIVKRGRNSSAESIVLSGQQFTDFIVTDTGVVAVAGDTLYFAGGNTITVASGDDIIALVAVGEVIYASTSAGVVYKVSVDDAHGPLVESIFTSALPINHLATDNDHLFYAVANSLHQYNLTNKQDQSVTFATDVLSVDFTGGAAWAAVNNEVYRISLTDWQQPVLVNTQASTLFDLAIDGDQLMLAMGVDGARIIQLSAQVNLASPALATPVAGFTYKQGQFINLSLADSSAVAAVSYYINGDLVSTNASKPFNTRLQVPALLQNGNARIVQVVVRPRICR